MHLALCNDAVVAAPSLPSSSSSRVVMKEMSGHEPISKRTKHKYILLPSDKLNNPAALLTRLRIAESWSLLRLDQSESVVV